MRAGAGLVVLGLAAVACGGRTGGAADASTPVDDGGDAGAPVDTGVVDAESGVLDSGVPLEAAPTDAAFDQGDGCDSQRVAAPTFSPPAGDYTCTEQVTISTTTAGATIFYTLDGSSGSAMEYTVPVLLSTSGTINAYAVAPCMRDSASVQASYTLNIPPEEPSPPTASVPAGTYGADFDVSLTSATTGATICYTLDGTEPNCSVDTGACTGGSKTYSASAPVAIDATVTDPVTGDVVLQAEACLPQFCIGGITPPVTYTLHLDPVAFAPAASATVPDGGVLSGVQITESGPATDQAYASICWSTDGTTVPDCTCSGATPANTPVVVAAGLYVSTGNSTPVMQVQEAAGASGITLRAVGCATGYAPSDAPYATITWK